MASRVLGSRSQQGAGSDRLAEAQEILAAEVAKLQSGEDWRRFLELQARLHAYSANNTLLIAAQHARAYAEGRVATPEPRYVAGFHTWRALGRSVERGQHGYLVLAPCRYERRVAVDRTGTPRPLRRSELPAPGETAEKHNVLAGFRVEHVFELSQTSGTDLAEPPMPRLLEGDAPAGLRAHVVSMIEARGFRVDTVPDASSIGGANGRTDWSDRSVLVRGDIDEAAMVKTLIHEAGHALLHEHPPGSYLARPLKEVEAESVAYVVAFAHGMATESYSFPYVALWAGKEAPAALQSCQQRVAAAAREILASSPASHGSGGKVPGAEAAVLAARARRSELGSAVADLGMPTTGPTL